MKVPRLAAAAEQMCPAHARCDRGMRPSVRAECDMQVRKGGVTAVGGALGCCCFIVIFKVP